MAPTTQDLDLAWELKQAALDQYRASRFSEQAERQSLLDCYVDAVAQYERIRAQVSDNWLERHPEFDAANDNFEADMVNNPPHYTDGDIECIDAIRAALGAEGFRAFCRGNAMKYIWRCELKDNTETDLEKASWYIETALEEAGG